MMKDERHSFPLLKPCSLKDGKDFPLTSFQVAIVNCSIVFFELKWIDSALSKTKDTAVLSNQLKSNNLCHFREPKDCFFCLRHIVNRNKSCKMFAWKAQKTRWLNLAASNASLGTVSWAIMYRDWIFYFLVLCFGICVLILCEIFAFGNDFHLLVFKMGHCCLGVLEIWVWFKELLFYDVIHQKHQRYTTVQDTRVDEIFT